MARPLIGDIGPTGSIPEKEKDFTWEDIKRTIRYFVDLHEEKLHRRTENYRIVEEGKEEVLVFNPTAEEIAPKKQAEFIPRRLNPIRLRTSGLYLADMAREIIGLVGPCLERGKLEAAIDEFEKEAKL